MSTYGLKKCEFYFQLPGKACESYCDKQTWYRQACRQKPSPVMNGFSWKLLNANLQSGALFSGWKSAGTFTQKKNTPDRRLVECWLFIIA